MNIFIHAQINCSLYWTDFHDTHNCPESLRGESLYKYKFHLHFKAKHDHRWSCSPVNGCNPELNEYLLNGCRQYVREVDGQTDGQTEVHISNYFTLHITCVRQSCANSEYHFTCIYFHQAVSSHQMSGKYYWISSTDMKSGPQKIKQTLNMWESVPVCAKKRGCF